MIAIEAGIVAEDLDALVAFYCDALGFDVAHELSFPQGEVRRLVRGGAQLKLYRPASGTLVHDRHDPWHTASGWAYAALHTDDAAREVASVATNGGRVITDVTSHRPGARFALVADPEGNVWEILEERG